MDSSSKNNLDPKIGPKIGLIFFLSEYSCVIYHWNQKNMLILKMNVKLALFLTFSCYFMESRCIKMKKFRIFYQIFAQKLSISLSCNIRRVKISRDIKNAGNRTMLLFIYFIYIYVCVCVYIYIFFEAVVIMILLLLYIYIYIYIDR